MSPCMNGFTQNSGIFVWNAVYIANVSAFNLFLIKFILMDSHYWEHSLPFLYFYISTCHTADGEKSKAMKSLFTDFYGSLIAH